MQLPIEITFRHMNVVPALEQHIRQEAAELLQAVNEILHCHVIVDAPHLHCRQGHEYHVNILLRLPARDIVIHHVPSKHCASVEGQETQENHSDVYVAVRDAFETARRQVREYLQDSRAKEAPAAKIDTI